VADQKLSAVKTQYNINISTYH